MDEDGFHYIVGRKKDMILASGYNIYPDEIDRMLMGHPAVLEAATIGVPDEKRGETVKSVVVLAPGSSLTADEVIADQNRVAVAYTMSFEENDRPILFPPNFQCFINDPDGNLVEFSYDQGVYEKALEVWGKQDEQS